ncbi:hypothetical protein ACH40E_43155 [Streptomyces acidicola]|uniref:hypothetical protein n=1 Tax=Streptomyces acidicola TaxID=2596892 RepID=UPI00379ECF93
MKQLKVAAVLAGSFVVAGAASPAFAAQPADVALPLNGLSNTAAQAQKGTSALPAGGRTKHGKGVANLSQIVPGGLLKGLPVVK